MSATREPVFILIHSPLVGPATWMPVATELRRRGHAARITSLAAGWVSDASQWPRRVDALRTWTVGHRAVLVGHSGGGLFLPAIAESVGGAIAALVFVDSFIPPPVGEVPLVPPGFREELRALAVGDELPPWSSWFGPQAMQELVPDDDARGILEAEMPRLPAAFLDMSVPVPAGWDRLGCAYVLLTRESYGESAFHAHSRGWPTVNLGGGHLATVNQPPAVADTILRLTRSY